MSDDANRPPSGVPQPPGSSPGDTDPPPDSATSDSATASGVPGSSTSAEGTGSSASSATASSTTKGSAAARSTAGRRRGDPKRRRRLIISAVAVAAALAVLSGCLIAGVLVRSGVRLAERAEDSEDSWERLEQSCLELETRLNRLAPPGAFGGQPRRRAEAIDHENAAVRPLLDELTAMSTGNRAGRDERRERWTGDWQRLVDARTVYSADLRRESATREPAFFLSPRSPDGDVTVTDLERRGPDPCAGPVRRLARPDL